MNNISNLVVSVRCNKNIIVVHLHDHGQDKDGKAYGRGKTCAYIVSLHKSNERAAHNQSKGRGTSVPLPSALKGDIALAAIERT